MRASPANAYCDALRALGDTRELALGRLPVHQIATRCGESIRGSCSIRTLLLTDDEEQIHAALTVLRKAIGGAEHGGCDPLGVGRSAPGEAITLKPRREVRWDGVEMRRESAAAATARRPHIGAPAGDLLQTHVPPAGDEPTRHEIDRGTFGAGRRINCQ